MSYKEKYGHRDSRLMPTGTVNIPKTLCAAVGIVGALIAQPMSAQEIYIDFDIPPQQASSSLITLGEQAGISVMVEHRVREIKLSGLKGSYSVTQALDKLLKDTDLVYKVRNDSVIVSKRAVNNLEINRVKKGTKNSLFAAVSAALLSSFAATEVSAEDGVKSTQVIEEIVVTSTKSGSRSLQDVPLTIKAFSGETLERMGVDDFVGFAGAVPGLSYQDNGPGDKKYIIRGIQSVGAATTGVYFDEIVITGSNGQDGGGRQPDLKLVDIAQIEVLKGPQGTLYGASSMSGTIRIIPNKPNRNEYEFFAEAGFSNTARGDYSYETNFVGNIPLANGKSALRGVFYSRDNTGFIDNLGRNDKDANDEKTMGGRLSLSVDLADTLTLDLLAIYQDLELGGSAFSQVHAPGNRSALAFPGDPRYTLSGSYSHWDHVASGWDEELDAYNATLNWELSHGLVTATSSYMDREISPPRDASWEISYYTIGTAFEGTPEDYLSTLRQPQSRSIQSNELRYSSNWDSPFEVVVGAFYQVEEFDFRSNVQGVTADGALIAQETYLDRYVEQELTQTAFFGEANYHLTDKLTLTFGARRFDISIEQSSQTQTSFTFDFSGTSTPILRTDSDETGTTYKAGLSYQLNEDILLYATYSEGFRPGGNNEAGINNLNPPPPSYGSDSLENYELGIKSEWFEKRLLVNGAVYLMDWDDIQVRNSIPGSSGFLDNAGKAHVLGVELDLKAYLSDAFHVGMGLSLSEAELDEDQPTGALAFPGVDGDRIPNVPEKTGNIYLEYNWMMPGINADAYVRSDIAYVGSSYNAFRPDDPHYIKIGGYTTVNLNFNMQRNNWNVSLYGTNLLNDDASQGVRFNTDIERHVLLKPRTIGVRVSKTF